MPYKCDTCEKNFASKFSLERHRLTKHDNDDDDDDADEDTAADVSDTGESENEHDEESQHDDDDDVNSEEEEEGGEAASDEEQRDETEETEDSEENVWNHYADTAWNEIEDVCSQQGHGDADWKALEKKLNKEFVETYMNDLIHYENLKKDPTHQATMKTKRKLIKQYDMSEEEAISAAVKQRKYLIVSEAPDWRKKMDDDCEHEETGGGING